jgi:hypothetical protein
MSQKFSGNSSRLSTAARQYTLARGCRQLRPPHSRCSLAPLEKLSALQQNIMLNVLWQRAPMLWRLKLNSTPQLMKENHEH